MTRGDVVVVAASGDYGKPRPAVIVQSDAFPSNHPSVIVCQATSRVLEATEFRITVEPRPDNGLRVRSQIIADKPTTVRRSRIGQRIGRLSREEMTRLNAALVFAVGIGG